jgi:hypothetical protein
LQIHCGCPSQQVFSKNRRQLKMTTRPKRRVYSQIVHAL